MPKLVKYCEHRFNIAEGCQTLRLGTLAYYKNLDPQFSIADDGEGRSVTFVESYSPGMSSPDAKAHISHDVLKNSHMENCVINDGYPNSLIFCTSLDPCKEYLDHARKTCPSYDSYYLISNIESFAGKIAHLLLDQFQITWFDTITKKRMQQFTVNNYKQIGLKVQHDPVCYVASKDTTIKNGQLHAPNNNLLLTGKAGIDLKTRKAVFSKNDKYSSDREYRILFTFVHPMVGIMATREEPIDISTNILSEEISE